MQQVACMLHGEAADVDIQMRAPYVEAALATGVFSLAQLRQLRRPRIFKTHASWDDLPVAGATGGAPPPEASILVVARDPRDVMVSLYYHSRSIKGISYEGTWDEWYEAFVGGTAPLPMAASSSSSGKADSSSSDWFEHTLGWWRVAQAHPGQVLFTRYEDMLDHPLEEVCRGTADLMAVDCVPACASSRVLSNG